MTRPVDHAAMPLCGFVEPWSVGAGGTIGVHLSSIDPRPGLRVVRLDRGGCPGVDWAVERLGPVAVQTFSRGAWIEVPLPAARIAGQAFTLTAEWLVTANPTARPVLTLGEVALWLGADGVPRLRGPDGEVMGTHPLAPWCWMTLTLRVRAGSIEVVVAAGAEQRLAVTVPPGWRPPARLRLGAESDAPRATLNARYGRIDLTVAGAPVAEWRFPAVGPVAVLPPVAGDWPPLRLHNAPTFVVASARWTGAIHDPRLDPAQYDAVHCHAGDAAGLDWPEAARVAVPQDAEAGVYAIEAAAGGGVERIAFFVRGRTRRAQIAFLAPTLTYLAYADEALPRDRFPWVCEDRGHAFAEANGWLSLYDVHEDGTGVSLASTRRPKATLRDDALYPLAGCPHLLPVDLRLLRFCAAEGIACDLLTDHDLHAEGGAALEGYAGVFTGSHPEYWTEAMHAALAAFRAGGGSLAYLGGNGFMWVAAVAGEWMEVRRGRGLASRTWDGRPGEDCLALTGEIGGLWRDRGRPEFAVAGTAMTLMGFGPARPYRRTPESRDPAYAWVFEGVAGELFGDAGTVLGGAAGYEVDRVDAARGTPPGTVVLARATGFDPTYETDANEWFATAEARAAARRADMAIRVDAAGGFVFAAGSVAWCGALPDPGGANDVGRITANVLRRLGQRAGDGEPSVSA